jgi:hypothetical protein
LTSLEKREAKAQKHLDHFRTVVDNHTKYKPGGEEHEKLVAKYKKHPAFVKANRKADKGFKKEVKHVKQREKELIKKRRNK